MIDTATNDQLVEGRKKGRKIYHRVRFQGNFQLTTNHEETICKKFQGFYTNIGMIIISPSVNFFTSGIFTIYTPSLLKYNFYVFNFAVYSEVLYYLIF